MALTIYKNVLCLRPFFNPCFLSPTLIKFEQIRGAARRGKRIAKAIEARKKAIEKKQNLKSTIKEEKKPRYLLEKNLTKIGIIRFNDSNKPERPEDNVLFSDDYKIKSYSFDDALKMHCEAHHPSLFNQVDALLEITLELSLKTKKKTKFLEAFSSTVTFPHKFFLKRLVRIIAIAKTIEDQNSAKEAGAFLVGGNDIIKNFKSGLVTLLDFDHIVCHNDMLLNLTEIRGLLKHHFPNKLKNNFGQDIASVVKKFYEGYDYEMKPYNTENEYGYIKTFVGRLNLNTEQIKENIIELIKDAERFRPKDAPGEFVNRIWISSPVTEEKFLVKHDEFIQKV